MLTKELLVQNKDNLQSLAENVEAEDIDSLVEWLKEKNDSIRYAAFLLLQLLSALDDRVYRHWDTFVKMSGDVNSYQRSLGLMLIAENIRWDKEDNFEKIASVYLAHCDDEKFITARQCIQGLTKIIEHAPQYRNEIVETLLGIDLEKRKDSQKGLLLLDSVEVLAKLFAEQREDRIEAYFRAHLAHGHEQAKKRIKKALAIC